MFTIKLSRRSPFNLTEFFSNFLRIWSSIWRNFPIFCEFWSLNLTEFFPIFCEFWYFIKIRNLLEHLALECICDSDFRSFFVESRNLPWKFYFRSVILNWYFVVFSGQWNQDWSSTFTSQSQYAIWKSRWKWVWRMLLTFFLRMTYKMIKCPSPRIQKAF